jgi:hypothetical protein
LLYLSYQTAEHNPSAAACRSWPKCSEHVQSATALAANQSDDFRDARIRYNPGMDKKPERTPLKEIMAAVFWTGVIIAIPLGIIFAAAYFLGDKLEVR